MTYNPSDGRAAAAANGVPGRSKKIIDTHFIVRQCLKSQFMAKLGIRQNEILKREVRAKGGVIQVLACIGVGFNWDFFFATTQLSGELVSELQSEDVVFSGALGRPKSYRSRYDQFSWPVAPCALVQI